jgi:hypothetical protein
MWENIRTMDDLSLEEAQELAAELAKLSKQQADSLQTVTYIPGSKVIPRVCPLLQSQLLKVVA